MWGKGCCNKKGSVKIALIYVLISTIWIFTTDWTLSKLNLLNEIWMNTGKGILFVIATGFLLKKLIKSHLKGLEDRQQQLNSLIENNTDAIINLDLDGNITSVNYATEIITGYSLEELIKKELKDLVADEDLRKFNSHYWDIVEGRPSIIELKGIRKNGQYMILEVKNVPIIINNKMVGSYVIARDITELKEKEELIRKSEKLSIIGELATAVAHEVRNPLTSLKGFLQLFRYKTTDEKDKGHYDIMLSEIERINSIVSEFMILSKPQAISYKNKNVTTLLIDVITLLETIAIMKNIEIIREFDQNFPFTIKCEGNQIKQVFINVIKNAIESVPNNGNIRIKVKKFKQNKVIITFIDNGCGIPDNLIPKLGEPFYTTKEKGTGLGLMVSYKIIEEHGGQIKIKSKLNKGTTVDVILPLSNNE